MNRTLLLGLSCILFAGFGGKPKPASTPAPASPALSNVVIIPPDSPKLAQIRVEQIKFEAMPADEVIAPGKVEANLNRVSRVPPPVAGRGTQAPVKLGDSATTGQPSLTLESPEANAATTTYRQSESAVIGCNALPLRRL